MHHAVFTNSGLKCVPDWALTVPDLVNFSISSLDPFDAELAILVELSDL